VPANKAPASQPGLVPCWVGINYTIWERHDDRLDKLQQECPAISIGGKDGGNTPRAVAHKSRDEWGCLWHFPGRGLDGVVIEHPLDAWDKLGAWEPPSPARRIAALQELPADQSPRSVGTEHGFIFLRLTYLRGFDNFMIDAGEGNPKLYELRDLVADYWYDLIKAHLDRGATSVSAADDLGLQHSLPVSPATWRRLLKPAYARIFGLARERGATVSLHTDGYIVDIIPDLIEVGATTLNPQDLVNGLDNLARLAKGKVHLSLDIDRQKTMVFGTCEEIDAHIERCIRTLGSPEGGLSLVWGVYPGNPLDSIEAGVRAMQRHHDMWVR